MVAPGRAQAERMMPNRPGIIVSGMSACYPRAAIRLAVSARMAAQLVASVAEPAGHRYFEQGKPLLSLAWLMTAPSPRRPKESHAKQRAAEKRATNRMPGPSLAGRQS